MAEPPRTPAPARGDIELDATAVLAFDDGARVPCDRFILRTFSMVVRRLLEDSACRVDDRGRTVVPAPCQPSAPFWLAVDVLHGVAPVWSMPLDDVIATSACMQYLGVTVHDPALDSRLWHLVRDQGLPALLPHAPRLLRNPSVSCVVLRRLIQLRPMWRDFVADVLTPLSADADVTLVNAVVSYAPNFFPPSLVLLWALDACPHLTQDAALRLTSQHGVMYHPADSPAVLQRLADLADARRWDGWLGGMLRCVVSSMQKYDVAPAAATRVHGSIIKFHDIPTASVCLAVEPGRLPARVRVAPWLKLSFAHDGSSLDLALKPRKIDELAADAPGVQVRLMCVDGRDPARGACAETWYTFDTDGAQPHDTYVLAQASATLGDVDAVPRMLRNRRVARQLRLDLFFGRHSIFDNPFDPAVATKATVNFLLSNVNGG
jgi:hypothetical protein